MPVVALVVLTRLGTPVRCAQRPDILPSIAASWLGGGEPITSDSSLRACCLTPSSIGPSESVFSALANFSSAVMNTTRRWWVGMKATRVEKERQGATLGLDRV
jgi:hypothetical protein